MCSSNVLLFFYYIFRVINLYSPFPSLDITIDVPFSVYITYNNLACRFLPSDSCYQVISSLILFFPYFFLSLLKKKKIWLMSHFITSNAWHKILINNISKLCHKQTRDHNMHWKNETWDKNMQVRAHRSVQGPHVRQSQHNRD